MFNTPNTVQEKQKLYDNFFCQNNSVAAEDTLVPKTLDLKLASKNEDLVSLTNPTNSKNSPFEAEINDKIKNDTFKNMFYLDGINGRSQSAVKYLSQIGENSTLINIHTKLLSFYKEFLKHCG